jgi:hypothetical protein
MASESLKFILFIPIFLGSLVSCAPAFHSENSKMKALPGAPSSQDKPESFVFDIQPTVPRNALLRLPEQERRVGTGENTVELGHLEIRQSQIYRLENGKKIRFTGKGELNGQKFDIDLKGTVDSAGKAQMFPQDTATQAFAISTLNRFYGIWPQNTQS